MSQESVHGAGGPAGGGGPTGGIPTGGGGPTGGGHWLGVWCGAESWELDQWSEYLQRAGAPDGVVGFLRSASGLLSGRSVTVTDVDRLREIEIRAVESIEGRRADVAARAGQIVGRVFADTGANMGHIMSAAGMEGWRDGIRNSGRDRSRSRTVSDNPPTVAGRVVKKAGVAGHRTTGGAGSTAEDMLSSKARRGGPGRVASGGRVLGGAGVAPVSSKETLRSEAKYAKRFEAWAGVMMADRGIKMRHIARGLGVDTGTAWRFISAYRRLAKREGLAGRKLDFVQPDWEDRLRTCIEVAVGIGKRGGVGKGMSRVVMNGAAKEEE